MKNDKMYFRGSFGDILLKNKCPQGKTKINKKICFHISIWRPVIVFQVVVAIGPLLACHWWTDINCQQWSDGGIWWQICRRWTINCMLSGKLNNTFSIDNPKT